ncbi:hypothetical protein JL720_1370 [Aureococcus anophagefferens]|nr:hypothetical protein JL720_1370 [Aureococcus anophagefferens]
MSRAAADARAALRDGCPVDALDDNGLTALHLAAFNGVAEVVEALVEAGGPNFVARESRGGMNVLHLQPALARPTMRSLRRALRRQRDAAAGPLARAAPGQLTPKDRAVLNGHERLALLFGAVERLDDAEVERILATACAAAAAAAARAVEARGRRRPRPRRRPCDATFAPIANPDQRRPSPPKPRAASSGQSSMNLQQLLQDVVQQLGKEERIRFREFVQELKAKRDAGEIPSLSEALLAGGENAVPANAVVIDIGDSDDDAPPPPNRPHVIDLT